MDVFVSRTGGSLCPVMAVGLYISFRGPESGPFFQLPLGRPLQKSTFVESVRAALSSAGFPSSQYAGHSFRIGAATEAARLGLKTPSSKRSAAETVQRLKPTFVLQGSSWLMFLVAWWKRMNSDCMTMA